MENLTITDMPTTLYKVESNIDGKRKTRTFDKEKAARNFFAKFIDEVEEEGGYLSMSIKEGENWEIINEYDIPND
jgi:hypothetical protein